MLLFFAVVAAAQNEPSEKIEQIVSGDNVKAQPFFLEWNKDSYSMTQTVDAGKPIGGIVFDYEGMNDWNVTGLPSGLVSEIDETNHKITIHRLQRHGPRPHRRRQNRSFRNHRKTSLEIKSASVYTPLAIIIIDHHA